MVTEVNQGNDFQRGISEMTATVLIRDYQMVKTFPIGKWPAKRDGRNVNCELHFTVTIDRKPEFTIIEYGPETEANWRIKFYSFRPQFNNFFLYRANTYGFRIVDGKVKGSPVNQEKNIWNPATRTVTYNNKFLIKPIDPTFSLDEFFQQTKPLCTEAWHAAKKFNELQPGKIAGSIFRGIYETLTVIAGDEIAAPPVAAAPVQTPKQLGAPAPAPKLIKPKTNLSLRGGRVPSLVDGELKVFIRASQNRHIVTIDEGVKFSRYTFNNSRLSSIETYTTHDEFKTLVKGESFNFIENGKVMIIEVMHANKVASQPKRYTASREEFDRHYGKALGYVIAAAEKSKNPQAKRLAELIADNGAGSPRR